MPRVGAMVTMLLLVLVTCGPPTAGLDTRLGTAAGATVGSALPPVPVPDEPPVPLPVDPPGLPVDPPELPVDPPELPIDPPVPLPGGPAAPAEPAAPPPPPEPAPPPPHRSVTETGWSPFATVAGVVLHHPSARVERIGFHEANHDGARQMEVAATAVHPMTLESRERGTGSRSAADVVVDPHVEIRAPVTGTVLRSGSYVLYCDYRDHFTVIEPDARPGWEVKVLHINGAHVRPGSRVQAGQTVLAGGPTPLPFSSQVDKHTAEPSWPHVHIEVVDPSIPNRPRPGGRC